jgi:hypothetical protein
VAAFFAERHALNLAHGFVRWVPQAKPAIFKMITAVAGRTRLEQVRAPSRPSAPAIESKVINVGLALRLRYAGSGLAAGLKPSAARHLGGHLCCWCSLWTLYASAFNYSYDLESDNWNSLLEGFSDASTPSIIMLHSADRVQAQEMRRLCRSLLSTCSLPKLLPERP